MFVVSYIEPSTGRKISYARKSREQIEAFAEVLRARHPNLTVTVKEPKG